MKILCAVVLWGATIANGADTFSFEVDRIVTPLRNESGRLEINNEGVTYTSDNKKTVYVLPFADIREADVSSPGRLAFETYDVSKLRLGGNRHLVFRLRSGTQDESLGRFLAEHLRRPVVGSYQLSQEGAFEIPAYHRGLLSGSSGVLLIGKTGIRFESKREKDSRTWLYRDIQTIGTSDPFHFRVTTYAETFTFDLKERLPDAVYELAWQGVYGLERK